MNIKSYMLNWIKNNGSGGSPGPSSDNNIASKTLLTSSDLPFYRAITKVTGLDTSELTSIKEMFYNFYELSEIELFDTSNVTSMQSAFFRL